MKQHLSLNINNFTNWPHLFGLLIDRQQKELIKIFLLILINQAQDSHLPVNQVIFLMSTEL